jgi:hypothetical protein
MKVRILKPLRGPVFSADPGNVLEVDEEIGLAWVEQGAAVAVETAEADPADETADADTSETETAEAEPASENRARRGRKG